MKHLSKGSEPEAKPKAKSPKGDAPKGKGDKPQGTPWTLDPKPFTPAKPGGGRTLEDPVYDPHTKTIQPWGKFRGDPAALRRPDEGHPGDWYDETYLQGIDALTTEEPPPGRSRDIGELGLKPIDIKRAPSGSSKGLNNILALLAKATPEEIDYWRNWYGFGHVEAVKLSQAHQRPVDLCAGVIAVLSPKEFWEQNLYLADRALAEDWTNVKALDPSRGKAYSLVVEHDFSVIAGQKVFDFFLSILDPVAFSSRVVVDTHAINIWQGVREGEAPSIAGSEYKRIAADYAKAGQAAGLSPQAVQAITWTLWRQYGAEGGWDASEQSSDRAYGKGRIPDPLAPSGEGDLGEPVEPQGRYGAVGEFILEARGRETSAQAAPARGAEVRAAEPITLGTAKGGKMSFGAGETFIFDGSDGVFFWLKLPRSGERYSIAPRLFGISFTHARPKPKPVPSGLRGLRVGVTAGATNEPKRPSLTMGELDMKPGAGVENILAVLNQATPEEVDFWSQWYAHAKEDVAELAAKHGVPFDIAAAVVATLSPGNKWHMNLRAADLVLAQAPKSKKPRRRRAEEERDPVVDDTSGYMAPEQTPLTPTDESPDAPAQKQLFEMPGHEEQAAPEIAPGINAYPANVAKAREILSTGDTSLVSGPKVTEFFHSLMDPKSVENRLVLDGHAMNIWRGEKRPLSGIRMPNKREREQMLADYARAAEIAGLPVQAVQAITWWIWRHVNPSTQMSLFAAEATRCRVCGVEIFMLGPRWQHAAGGWKKRWWTGAELDEDHPPDPKELHGAERTAARTQAAAATAIDAELYTCALQRRLAAVFNDLVAGQIYTANQDLVSSLTGARVPKGTALAFEGLNWPQDDPYFELQGIGAIENGGPLDNLRLRFVPHDPRGVQNDALMIVLSPRDLTPLDPPAPEVGEMEMDDDSFEGRAPRPSRTPEERKQLVQEFLSRPPSQPGLVIPTDYDARDQPDTEDAIWPMPAGPQMNRNRLGPATNPGRPPPRASVQRASASRVAAIVFEANRTYVEWQGRVGEDDIAAFGAVAVVPCGARTAHYGPPVVGPSGSGRYVLYVEGAACR